ncbi:hypothetical protein [Draconibacterium sp.]
MYVQQKHPSCWLDAFLLDVSLVRPDPSADGRDVIRTSAIG